MPSVVRKNTVPIKKMDNFQILRIKPPFVSVFALSATVSSSSEQEQYSLKNRVQVAVANPIIGTNTKNNISAMNFTIHVSNYSLQNIFLDS
jgi:hypothetical protein